MIVRWLFVVGGFSNLRRNLKSTEKCSEIKRPLKIDSGFGIFSSTKALCRFSVLYIHGTGTI